MTPLAPEETLMLARQAAEHLGFNPHEVYEPFLLVDVWQTALLGLHGMLGDGGLAVAVAAILIRVVTFPWNHSALQKQCDRMELLPVYMDLAKALQEAQRRQGGADGSGAFGAAKAEADVHRFGIALKDMTETTKFSPVQGMGYQFMCLFPLYILGYFTLRGIVAHPDVFRAFAAAPSLWLDSLVLPDPLGILPAVSAMAVLLNVEANSPTPRPGQEENAQYMRLVMRGAALTFAPVTTLLPSAMLVFMATNAAYTGVILCVYRRYFWTRPSIKPEWLIASTLKK